MSSIVATVTATLLQLVGADVPPAMRGKDLRPLITGDKSAARPYVFSSVWWKRLDGDGEERFFMLRTEEWKLCHYTRQRGELYDLKNDPGELTNLYMSLEHVAIRDALIEHLLLHLANTLEPPNLIPQGPPRQKRRGRASH